MQQGITLQHQKIALELKYLLSIGGQAATQPTLQLLNKLSPFCKYPLKTTPPIQFIQVNENQIITQDLNQLLKSYILLILLGKLRAQKDHFIVDQQRLIDKEIKQKFVHDIAKQKTTVTSLVPTTYLKIHNIWVDLAIKQQIKKQKQYIKQKLSKIDFFIQLSFNQFQKICDKSEIITLGPGQNLISEGSVPYHLYIVTEGQIGISKNIDFAKTQGAWQDLQIQLQKTDDLADRLFKYLIRQPSPNASAFSINFEINTVGQGVMLCGTQTLCELPLSFTISANLRTKLIKIKYPDLYVLQQPRLGVIRNWPLMNCDKTKIRQQYYYQKNWQKFKQFVNQSIKIQKLQRKVFEDFLRKQVKLPMTKYSYVHGKIGEGQIIDSPCQKINRIKNFTMNKFTC